MDINGVGLLMPIALIGHRDDMIPVHRVQHPGQVIQSRGDLLEQDAVLEGDVVHQQLAHTDGVDKPVAQVTSPQHLGISDKVAIAALAPALYLHMELPADGPAPLVERALQQVESFVQVLVVFAFPLVVNFLEGNATVTRFADRVQQPNVLIDNLCHSYCVIYYSATNIDKTCESRGHMLAIIPKKRIFSGSIKHFIFNSVKKWRKSSRGLKNCAYFCKLNLKSWYSC